MQTSEWDMAVEHISSQQLGWPTQNLQEIKPVRILHGQGMET